METQGSESPRGDISSSRRVLKMQTIPTETPERKRSTQQSFETDDEFQFRRHSAKKSRFGDRLQEFQSVKDARRVENFNSSFQVPPQSQEEHQQYTGQAFPPQYPAPTQLPSPQRMIPMPMVYYYAAANQQPGAVPAGTQPQQYAIPQQGMGINFQAMNQFIDPQYQEQQPYYQSLMPAPSFYPPPSSQEKLPNPLSQNRPILAPEDSRAKRKSFMIQRGRRLSLLNQENQLNDIISPHKDVHESEFYRYMNNSFAQDLKMKQLMNWCLIRALRKLEIKNSQNKSESRKITLTILKDFVRDIRKGSHDIDWDSEGPEAEPTVEDESEISNLFKEGNTENSILVDSSLSNKNKIPPIKLAKIPNEKNIQNKENAKILEEKIKTIKNEIEQWSKDLSDVKIPSYELPKSQTSIVKLPDNLQLTATTKESIHSDFQKRVDGLQETTRLLKSSSILLNETAGMKLQRLNGCIVKKRPEDKNSTKKLLRGLSRSLMQ
ncbi:MIND complex subunit DSN1 [Kluyveromyces lactis]|uniref:KLLA0D15741p n=1 Tax=Kluyveromyces lactis (strain ATCC 8585 / CBS 2359 / DSM 70799 / NBRC 1267 / NRRL Y-1140 / WM37) TaxID=284590 RepID=Q6CQN5_KLULA|nr:uncharacterized protein KLLA0_D15741g [Kluyveromyces lactis]CAH00850.1 KLLA0D15741p [Kluyveromyces lactis]|eukprot:XP_453754.1 uncharacterized protein KLLA0_D15741g [Kluyveromyces lactis]